MGFIFLKSCGEIFKLVVASFFLISLFSSVSYACLSNYDCLIEFKDMEHCYQGEFYFSCMFEEYACEPVNLTNLTISVENEGKCNFSNLVNYIFVDEDLGECTDEILERGVVVLENDPNGGVLNRSFVGETIEFDYKAHDACNDSECYEDHDRYNFIIKDRNFSCGHPEWPGNMNLDWAEHLYNISHDFIYPPRPMGDRDYSVEATGDFEDLAVVEVPYPEQRGLKEDRPGNGSNYSKVMKNFNKNNLTGYAPDENQSAVYENVLSYFFKLVENFVNSFFKIKLT